MLIGLTRIRGVLGAENVLWLVLLRIQLRYSLDVSIQLVRCYTGVGIAVLCTPGIRRILKRNVRLLLLNFHHR